MFLGVFDITLSNAYLLNALKFSGFAAKESMFVCLTEIYFDNREILINVANYSDFIESFVQEQHKNVQHLT